MLDSACVLLLSLSWAAGDKVTIWAFSNADAVELFLNGASLGLQNMTTYAHVEWDNVTYIPGSLKAVSYSGGQPVQTVWRNTTGPAVALQISVKDGVGSTLVAGCQDVAYVQVELVDANGAVVPTASDVVTFSVTGAGVLAGTANGDPACLVNNKSPWRPAFGGLVLGVVLTSDATGTVKVEASAPGLGSASLVLNVEAQPADFSAYWCKNGPRL